MAPLDWAQPWFDPWREAGERVATRWAACADLARALNAEPATPVRFVPQGELPAGAAYEPFIFETASSSVTSLRNSPLMWVM